MKNPKEEFELLRKFFEARKKEKYTFGFDLKKLPPGYIVFAEYLDPKTFSNKKKKRRKLK